ncbi:NUDIX domain-containing protein [Streptomyces sp. Y1]|uniref:NUDIX domain-containing protein n=1 Tax=Streptomyces sp. Y1 TaxID=3238634 RepID=A0AB39TXE0_9ACTN
MTPYRLGPAPARWPGRAGPGAGVRGAAPRRPPLPDPPPARSRPPALAAGSVAETGEDPVDALHRELPEELGLDLAVLPNAPVLRFVQDQETERPGERAPFRRRHLVFTAHLPDHLVAAVAAVELDDSGQAPVVWLSAADAVGLHLYPDVGAVLDRAVGPDATVGGPVLLPAMTGASYQWR